MESASQDRLILRSDSKKVSDNAYHMVPCSAQNLKSKYTELLPLSAEYTHIDATMCVSVGAVCSNDPSYMCNEAECSQAHLQDLSLCSCVTQVRLMDARSCNLVSHHTLYRSSPILPDGKAALY